MRLPHLACICGILFGIVLMLLYAVPRALPQTQYKPTGRRALSTCKNLIAIGDLHGDLNHTIKIMRAAKLVDANLDWIAGDHVCAVQTGDLVDRGHDNLYPIFEKWRKQSNDMCVNLLGNHDIMNLQGDERYVSPKEIDNWPGGYQGRVKDWKGKFGRRIIENFHAAHLQNGNLFVHAGLLPQFAYNGNISELVAVVRRKLLRAHARNEQAHDELFYNDGPFWTRDFMEGERKACPLLSKTLSLVGADRMIIGHTQVMYGIQSYCGGRLIAIDTANSRSGYPSCWGALAHRSGFYGAATFLEIVDGEAYGNIVDVDSEVPAVLSRTHLPLSARNEEL